MNKNYLIIVLLFFCSILNAQNLNIVYIGNSITEGALLKNPKTEAAPIRASQYLDKHLNGKVTFRNCGVSGMTTLNFLPISGQQFPNVKTAASELAQREGQLLFSISLGTNDSACTMAFGAPVLPEEYYTNMKAIIDELLALYPQSKIVVQYPIWYSPNTYNGAMYLKAGLERLKSYYPMIEKLMAHYSITHPKQVFPGSTEAFDFFKENYSTHFTPEEGNAWQYTWHVQHDVPGLINLFGGEEPFLNKLDSLFTLKLETTQADVTGLIGQYAHGNEPSHHITYLYALAGRPERTQELVREIFDTQYRPEPDGLCGNDDCGQMSAWYMFSAMGFYPVDPVSGNYVFGAPQMPKIVLHLADGKTFTVIADGISKEHKYIDSITLNGEPYTKNYISHEDILKGGTLVYKMK